MITCRTKAIALRKNRLGEADAVITFLTEKYGKLRFLVKGLYLLKSRYYGKLEPSLCVDLTFSGSEMKTLLLLNSCDLLNSYKGIREEPEKIFHAFYFLELIDSCLRDRDADPSIFYLLDTALSLLEETEAYETLVRVFELRLLAHMGYSPKLNACVDCGGLPAQGPLYLSFEKGGILCSHCGNQGSGPGISRGSVNFAVKGVTIHDRRIGRLRIPKNLTRQVELLAHHFLISRIGRECRSYRFLNLK